jgi:hypothetical protein
MAGDGRAQMLMLALCGLENSPISGTNGHLATRFGTEEPSAPSIKAVYGQNVGAWLSLVERPVEILMSDAGASDRASLFDMATKALRIAA